MKKYDVIVVGCGGVGSAALYSLSSRGFRVAGLDKFSPPHHNGSSHGHTRAIRKAYFEHPDYVPLLQSSYKLWRELEQKSHKELMNLVGLLEVGPPDGMLVTGVRQSAELHNLPVEFLSPSEVSNQFPGLSLREEFEIAYEKDAGYLLVEDCIESFLSLAVNSGAELLTETMVLDWSAKPGGVSVRTSKGLIAGDALILAGGPWASSLLGSIDGVRLELRKKHMYWYSNQNPKYFSSSGFPVFALELPEEDNNRVYYGFPQINSDGVKLAEHTGGLLVNSADNVQNMIDPDANETDLFRRTYLPHISGSVSRHESCLYTLSHDENFYLDVHPQFDNVAFAAGLSGHGFKFAPVLGEVLADLVTKCASLHEFGYLRAKANRA